MKKIVIALLAVFLILALAGCGDSGSGGKIKLSIISETSKSDWGNIEFDTHYYSISGAGTEIPKTPLPHNQTMVIELPKTNESYTLTLYTQGVYADGKTPSKPHKYICSPFKGNESLELTFTCELRGGAHGIESKRSITFAESSN